LTFSAVSAVFLAAFPVTSFKPFLISTIDNALPSL
jgi:hypothetical protein